MARTVKPMANLAQKFLEIIQMYRQGTLLGVIRYIKFKSLRRSRVGQFVISEGAPLKGMGLIGVGNYVVSVHLPNLKALRVSLYAATSLSGDSACAIGKLYGMSVVYPNIDEMLAAQKCDALLIATPHYLHVENILRALDAGLYTYCEKPVAIDEAGIEKLIRLGLKHPSARKIMIGFNRRFAPTVMRLKEACWLKERTQPLEIHYRVNFGPRMANMMSDTAQGGGRIHGAACHYVDLIVFLAGVSIDQVSAMAIGDYDDNTFVAVMKLRDGSLASLTFTSEGSRKFDSKEEIMITCGQHTARISDFSCLNIDSQTFRYFRHTYGAMQTMRAFIDAKCMAASAPVSLADGVAATRVTLAIQKSIVMNGVPQSLLSTQ